MHELYCHSVDTKGQRLVTTAQIESITKAKRAANDVCSWGKQYREYVIYFLGGFLAECQISSSFINEIQ